MADVSTITSSREGVKLLGHNSSVYEFPAEQKRQSKFSKMGEFLSRMPMNHRAKFDSASFILAGKIRNRTKLQTNKQ